MAIQTQTLTVVTLEANADGISVSAEVRREDDRYIIVVDGRPIDSSKNLRPAYDALAVYVRRRLPRGQPGNLGRLVALQHRRLRPRLREPLARRRGEGAASSTPAYRRP